MEMEEYKMEEENWREMGGKVKYINLKNRRYGRIYVREEDKEYRILLKEELEFEIGDIIYGICKKKGDYYYFEKDPVVILGEEEETIIRCICQALKEIKCSSKNGKKIRDKLWRVFGTDERICYELDRMAGRYMTNDGREIVRNYLHVLSLGQWGKILKWWYKNRCQRRLRCLGLTDDEIQTAIKYFEDINVVYYKCLENTYAIVNLDFEKCEQIQIKLGKTASSLRKMCGLIVRTVDDWLEKKDWVCVPLEDIKKKYTEIDICRSELEEFFDVHFEYDAIYLNYPYRVEQYVATYIADRILSFDSEVTMKKDHQHLNKKQKKAVENALKNNIYCITGPAGTGKTTVIRSIVEELELSKKNYQVTSFTGKAVSKLREILKSKQPATLNRLLVMPKDKVKFEYVIIDEASMLTTALFYEFITKFNWPLKIIFIGDPNQLPPIGWGYLYDQLLKVPLIPKTQLKQIHRTSSHETNGILINSTRIIAPDLSSFSFIQTDNFKMIDGDLSTVITFLQNFSFPSSSFTILTPYNTDRDRINNICQQQFNTNSQTVQDKWSKTWKLGDIVIITKNNDDSNIMNGDLGHIQTLHQSSILVQFRDGSTHSFSLSPPSHKSSSSSSSSSSNKSSSNKSSTNKSSTNKSSSSENLTTQYLELAYALSIHRSQGSEWDDVIIYLPKTSMSGFVTRSLMYTAITRASKSIFCIGPQILFNKAIQTDNPIRYENLSQRLSLLFTIPTQQNTNIPKPMTHYTQ